ncbi:MAG TPA: GNAT family N-acetyltransferase [Nordella sp.]|nr:GNAT family N-acetyltransferase [Nordella sp.]
MRPAHLFHIRPYEPRDLDAASAAANAACRQAYAFFGYNHPVSVSRQRLLETLAEGQRCFVPEISGVVAGIFTLKPAFIDKLFIAPHWQGFGMGTACLDLAKELYPHGIELHCAQQNYGARRLYERHGFIAVTHLIFEPIGIGDVIYRWPGV